MNLSIKKLVKKVSIITAGVVASLALVAGSTAAVTLVQPVPAAASSCTQDQYPETNIIYCGLTGGTNPAQLMQSFQAYYNAGNDSHSGNPATHSDLKRVYNEVAVMSAGGFNSQMFTSGQWQLGSSSHDGNIRDNSNNIVGTNVMITSRCPVINNTDNANCKTSEISAGKYKPLTDGSGHITNVYYRDAKWFFDKDTNTMPTLLHFNSDHVLDFATWIHCGNALIFKPVVPQKSLVCTGLDYKQVSATDTTVDYLFTATATQQNTKDITYTIQYSNGGTDQVVVHDGSTKVTFDKAHTFNTNTTTVYTVTVQTNGQPQVAACAKSFSFTPKVSPTFACKVLDHVLTSGSSQSGQETYTFTANTQGTEDVAKTNGYQFFYSVDNGGFVSNGSQDSATFIKQFVFSTDKVHTFSVYFTAVSTPSGFKTNPQDTNCAYTFSTTVSPPVLTNAGPGETFGLIAGVTALATGIHQLIMRRRLS